MKTMAEAYLGTPITDAVLTVPVYFKDAQRQATKDAGAIAGLNILRIINETTASAIAYGFDNKTGDGKNVLIFDLGGGTFDVSILSIEDGVFDVKASAGDTHLGGQDFDNRLVRHFAEEFMRKHKIDLKTSTKALQRLRNACERAKRTLSSSNQVSIEIESLINGIDYSSKISRACFEDLNADLFLSTIEAVEEMFKDCGMDKSKIDDIVLIGGSTRIPKIQEMLKEFFNGKDLTKMINPDEAVAYGAAVQAAVLNGDKGKTIEDLTILDVTPLSLGVGIVGEVMSTLVNRNTAIPTKRTKFFTTVYDYQTAILFKVFEGENACTRFNTLLGSFTLLEIQLAPRCVPSIAVTFTINADGILKVTARDQVTGAEKDIKIDNLMGRLSDDDIERMIKRAEDYRLEDEKHLAKVNAKNILESLCYKAKTFLQGSVKGLVPDAEKQMIMDECEEILQWLKAKDLLAKNVYERCQKDFEAIWDPIAIKMRGS